MAKFNSDLSLLPTMTSTSTHNTEKLQEEEESIDGRVGADLLNATVADPEEDADQLIQKQLRQDEAEAEIEETFPNLPHRPASPGDESFVPPTHTTTDTMEIIPKKQRLSTPKARPSDLSKVKRNRRALRKDTYDVSDTENEDGDLFASEPESPPKRSKVLKTKEAQAPKVDNPKAASHSIDPILMPPTPLKSRHLPQSQSQIQPSTSPKPRNHSKTPASIPAAAEFADCVKTFDEMMVTLNRVGYKYTKETDRWALIRKVKEVKTAHGKRVESRIHRLITAYDTLRASIDEADGSENAEGKVTDIITKLKEELNQILNARLGRPDEGIDYFDDESTERILTDLYFILFPKFVKAIRFGVEVYDASMNYNSLCEFTEMLDLLYELVVTALNQPKSSQPHSGGAYQTVKPIQGILPALRDVRSKFRTEVKNHRKRKEQAEKAEARKKSAGHQRLRAVEEERREAERLAEMERTSQEQRRSRIEEDEARRRSRLVAERIKQQKKDLARAFADPVYGPRKQYLFEQAMAKHPKKRESQAKLPAETFGSSSQMINNDIEDDVEDDMEDDPLAEDDFERVSVFGKNNTSKDQGQKEISVTDKQTFVTIISTEHGDDRYEIAANTLNRSIEEIFQLAKDLQEAMDAEHEHGRMNSPEDEWTYYIWVDKQ